MDMLTTVACYHHHQLFKSGNSLFYVVTLKSVSCTVPVCSVSAVNLRECMHAYQPMALSTGTQASTVIVHSALSK